MLPLGPVSALIPAPTLVLLLPPYSPHALWLLGLHLAEKVTQLLTPPNCSIRACFQTLDPAEPPFSSTSYLSISPLALGPAPVILYS